MLVLATNNSEIFSQRSYFNICIVSYKLNDAEYFDNPIPQTMKFAVIFEPMNPCVIMCLGE
jgi:hypothetical protein